MNKEEIKEVVQQYLRDMFECTDDELEKGDIVFTKSTRCRQPYIKILAYKDCTVVHVSENFYDSVKGMLSGKNRDEVFECPLVYGQTIHYVPDMNFTKEPELPEEYTYELLEGNEINKLFYIQGFDNSLFFDNNGETSTQIVFLAKKENVIIGIAGAGAVTEKMWEAGIDVKPEYRNGGLGSALIKKLTLEILKKEIVPFYSASVTNIGSQMAADRAGYIPCWVDTFGNIFDKYYSYNYETVIKNFT